MGGVPRWQRKSGRKLQMHGGGMGESDKGGFAPVPAYCPRCGHTFTTRAMSPKCSKCKGEAKFGEKPEAICSA